MDPFTTAIVTALSAGTATAGREIATQAIKDAYAGLKNWIRIQYPPVSVDQLEKEPTSKARQQIVTGDLEREGVAGDTELARLAQTLVELIQKQVPDSAHSIGVDLGKLNQANVTFGNVLAGANATGIRVGEAKDVSISFGDVRAGSETDPSKKV